MNGRLGQRGFTLVEALIATVIIAVSSVIALPVLGTFLQQYRLGNSANQVAFEIARARMQAVAQNRAVKMRAEPDTHEVCRQTAPLVSSSSWTPSTCTDAADAIRLEGGTVVSGTFPVFDRTGVATESVTLTVQNSAGQMTIRVGVLGRVSVS